MRPTGGHHPATRVGRHARASGHPGQPVGFAALDSRLRGNDKEEGTQMKFGIFYELQLPRPWLPGGELQLYQNALDQVELADRLGYDYAWEVEHHFLEEYSHSPAPEVFLAAASQRTKRIRLAHGARFGCDNLLTHRRRGQILLASRAICP